MCSKGGTNEIYEDIYRNENDHCLDVTLDWELSRSQCKIECNGSHGPRPRFGMLSKSGTVQSIVCVRKIEPLTTKRKIFDHQPGDGPAEQTSLQKSPGHIGWEVFNVQGDDQLMACEAPEMSKFDSFASRPEPSVRHSYQHHIIVRSPSNCHN